MISKKLFESLISEDNEEGYELIKEWNEDLGCVWIDQVKEQAKEGDKTYF